MRLGPARTWGRIVLCAGALSGLATTHAFAHASDRGHVLLLPTGHYLVGGALAVLASFLVLAVVAPEPLYALARKRWHVAGGRAYGRVVVSTLSFFLFSTLVFAGWEGSRDPLSNPLPLFFWTLLWIGLVIAQGVFGNLWSWLNPWYGPWRIVTALAGKALARPLLRWPAKLAMWPAFAGFAAFAWFELAYSAPDDPARLASVVAVYWLLIFAAMLVFGYWRCVERGEFLSLFLSMIARLSVFETKGARLRLRVPAAGLIDAKPLPFSGIAFLLLALSSVTFDGLRHTFFWLGKIGINPLEFPGRSAVVAETTFGLAVAFLLLASAFWGSVLLGHRLAGRDTGAGAAAAALVWTIIPISFAYHVAHYFPALLIDGQYALVALSDPFGAGWDLFGLGHFHVRAGIISGAQNAWIIWNFQAGTIVLGHVLAVVAAHIVAWRLYGSGRTATISQLPLSALMIGYTVIGLWLLSTPTAL